jgi:hypothetical protein
VSPDFEDYKHYNTILRRGREKTKKKKNLTMFDTKDIHVPSLQRTSFAGAADGQRRVGTIEEKTGAASHSRGQPPATGGLLAEQCWTLSNRLTRRVLKKQELKSRSRNNLHPRTAAADASEPVSQSARCRRLYLASPNLGRRQCLRRRISPLSRYPKKSPLQLCR